MGDYLDWNLLGSLIVIGACSYFVLRGYHRRIPRFFARNPFFRHWVKEIKALVRHVVSWRRTNPSVASKSTSKVHKKTRGNSPKIFINYRRKDTKSEARLLYQKLVAKFPRNDVMMDIDSIPAGEDFREFLRRSVKECDVFLALVGTRWMEFGDLKDPKDRRKN